MNHPVVRIGVFLSPALLLLLYTACSRQRPKNQPETVPVSGVVTYQGQPVEGARLAFLADTPGVQGGVALTDANGKFIAMTFEQGDGLVPGSFTVTVVKTVGGELTENSEAPPVPVKNVLPRKYERRETSPLKVEVKKGEPNNFTFDLGD